MEYKPEKKKYSQWRVIYQARGFVPDSGVRQWEVVNRL